MAQIIKHRRGGLESVSSATKRAGELLVITGSTGISADNGDGLLFIGIDGSTVTPANKILTGSSTPDLSGGSYDTSIDGLPFYNTSENKFYILGKGGNVEVQATANTNGTGIVSSSAQISGYNTFLEINGDSVVSSSAQVVSSLLNQDIDFGTGGISGSSLDITGNTKIDGNLVLGGNITIGDASTDTISFGGDVSSDIIPSADNTHDLGSSTDRFAEIHATTIYGSISATNGVVSGSSQINADETTGWAADVKTQLNSNTVISGSSQVFSDVSGDITIASDGTAAISSGVIVNADVKSDAAIDHTKIDFGGSGITSGSLNLSIAGDSGTDTVTVGSDTFTFAGTANEIETAVTDNTVTIGLPNDVTIGNNLTVVGNLEVQGTTTTVDSTTVTIGDNILALNGTGAALGGIEVNDSNGPASGSLLWNGTTNQWIAGASGSESKVLLANGDDVVSGSAQINTLIVGTSFSSSVDSRLDAVEATAGDLANTYLEINGDSVVSSSAQISAYNTFLEINGDSVVSSSAQVSAYNTFLEINGDSVVSSSAQISGYNTFLEINGDSVVSSSAQISGYNTFLEINGDSVVSSSAQITLEELTSGSSATDFISEGSTNLYYTDARVKTKLDAEDVVSGSAQIDGALLGSNNTISGVTLGGNLNNLTVDNSTLTLDTGTTYNGGTARTISVGEISNSNVAANAAIDHTKIDFGGSSITSGSLNLTVAGDNGSNDVVRVGVDTFTVQGSGSIETTISDNTITVGLVDNASLQGNITITGNLTVEGTTTTIDSTTVNIGDRILELNHSNGTGDAGLLVTDVDGTTVSGSLLWDASADNWIAGPLGSEKEIARINTSVTSNTVLKANGSGLLVDSLITDDGTDVTISGTAELRINNASANSFVYFDSNKSLESVTPSNAGDVIQWNGSSFVASNEIDGGTF